LDASWFNQPIETLAVRPVVAALPATSLRQVMMNMRQTRVSCVYRLDERGRPEAQFVEQQVWALLADRAVSLDVSIEPYLMPITFTVSSKAPIRSLLDCWREGPVEPVCVVNDAGEAVAMVEPTALVQSLAAARPVSPSPTTARRRAAPTVVSVQSLHNGLASA
jgi:CBS domain-containing protein